MDFWKEEINRTRQRPRSHLRKKVGDPRFGKRGHGSRDARNESPLPGLSAVASPGLYWAEYGVRGLVIAFACCDMSQPSREAAVQATSRWIAKAMTSLRTLKNVSLSVA